MGATKRIAELYVRSLARGLRRPGLSVRHAAPPTAFASVRFGNVIGSAGSVLTVWAKQLAAGGPLTVTDPRMTRYFMTIPEAASLVLQAAAMSTPDDTGTLSVLDMGDPVGVVDLAERFVRLHGLEPVHGMPKRETEIEIRCTGVRPGEKLHEALVYDSETLAPTAHGAVRTLLGDTDGPSTDAELTEMLARLDHARSSTDRSAVLEALAVDVPTLRSLSVAA
jgi:FlaA1/EpsC-like NDP-sugar epimerase